MQKIAKIALSPALAVLVLLALPGGLAAQETGQETPEQGDEAAVSQAPQEQPVADPAPRPRITGKVLRWTGNRIDLETPDGKKQKVAVNRETERLTEIKPGVEVVVEYRRKVSGFVIAQRVLAVDQEVAAAASRSAPGSVTGTLASWNQALLVVKTETGDVTFYLAPSTRFLVDTLQIGLPVTVEFDVENQGKLATRVRAAETP